MSPTVWIRSLYTDLDLKQVVLLWLARESEDKENGKVWAQRSCTSCVSCQVSLSKSTSSYVKSVREDETESIMSSNNGTKLTGGSSSNVAQKEHRTFNSSTEQAHSGLRTDDNLSLFKGNANLPGTKTFIPSMGLAKSAPWQGHRTRFPLSFHLSLWESLGSAWLYCSANYTFKQLNDSSLHK